MDLGQGRAVRALQTHVEAGEIIVDNLGIAAGHRPRKDGVDKVDDRARGAEVARQGQELSALAAPVALVAGKEEARFGEAEAVDGLLDVADREQAAAAGNAGDQRFLDVGYVLILIDEHVVVLRTDAGAHVLAGKGAQGAALKVRVGKAAALLLAAGVGFADAPGRVRQHREKVVERQRVLARLFDGQLAQAAVFHAIAGGLAQGFDGLEVLRGDVAVAA